MSRIENISTIGIVGFGAFGRLVTGHLMQHVRVVVSDRDPIELPQSFALHGVSAGSMADIGACDLVILAVPVAALTETIRLLKPHLRPGQIIVDVGSVKMKPAEVMQAELPPFVEIVGTHPLFGPQSAATGVAGHKIAVCPLRGRSAWRIAAFLRHVLGLKVYMTTPEKHDREAAAVQGLTHLIAKVLVRMEPLPSRLTTASFDALMRATDMVRHDAPSVYDAIENDNPFAPEVRRRFFELAAETCEALDDRQAGSLKPTPPEALRRPVSAEPV